MIGIYAIIIDDKYYIGQSVDIKRRWQQHRKELKSGIHENKHLQNAYNKYGNPKFEVLLECEKEKLNECEQYYIHELMTYDKNIGYNKSYGGETCLITEAFKEEYCIPILQFTKYGEFVAEYYGLNETIRKNKSSHDVIRNGIKERRKVKGFYFIEKKEYEKNPNLAELFNWKSIMQFDLQGNLIAEYFNIDKALKETNVNKESLKAVLNGKRQSANGYIWRYKEDYLLNPIVKIQRKKPKPNPNKKLQGTPIVQLDLEGNFIAEYPNSTTASKKVNTSPSNIRACVNKKQNNANGYRWIRKEEYIKNPEGYKVNFKKVVQLTEYGEFVNKYNSLNEATKETGIKTINLCLEGKNYIIGGYRWMYEEDYVNNNTDKYKIKEERKVVQLDLQGMFITEYHSVKEAEKKLGIKNVGTCLRKSKEECRYTAGGYLWIYKDEYDKNIQYKQKERKIEYRKGKTIIQLDLRGNQIGVYDSLIEAEKSTGIKRDAISRCLRGIQEITKDCKWKYANDKDDKKKNKK